MTTIAIGTSADEDLERLANVTGGERFVHDDGSSSLYVSLFDLSSAIKTSGKCIQFVQCMCFLPNAENIDIDVI